MQDEIDFPICISPLAEILHKPYVLSINQLYIGELCVRNPPKQFYTNKGRMTDHPILNEASLKETDITLATFDYRASVRGSAVIRFDDGLAFFPKCASEAMTGAFLDYNRSVFSPQSPDNNFYSYIDFNRMTYLPRRRIALDGDVVWVTPDEAFNWGMWLIQTLTSLQICEKYQIDAKILCYAGSEWQRKFLDVFAPSYHGRIVYQDLESEYFAKQGLRTFVRTQRNFGLGCLDASIFDSVAREIGSPSSIKKIFLSRINQAIIQPNHRVLVNERELCRLMESRGYTIVFPELLSFADQIGLFTAADIVVGVGGAGMFNTLFCKEGTVLLTLESSEQWLEAHANLFASRGLEYSIYLGDKVDKFTNNPHGNWYVDPLILSMAIDEVEQTLGGRQT